MVAFRARNVPTWALTQVLARARDAAMPGCGFFCCNDNVGSITTSERCGGGLQQTLEDDHGLARRYRRDWVALQMSRTTRRIISSRRSLTGGASVGRSFCLDLGSIPGPQSVERAFFIDSVVGVSAEEIALRLDECSG